MSFEMCIEVHERRRGKIFSLFILGWGLCWPKHIKELLCVCMMRKQTSLRSLTTVDLWENSLKIFRRLRCLLSPESALQMFSMKCTKGIVYSQKKYFIMFVFPFKVSPLRKFLFVSHLAASNCQLFYVLEDKKDQSLDAHDADVYTFLRIAICGLCCRMVKLIISGKEDNFKVIRKIVVNEKIFKRCVSAKFSIKIRFES